jgi:transposase
MTINDLSLRLAKVNKQLKRVKDKLATQDCLVYELTRRLQQAQEALVELQQKEQDCLGNLTNRRRDSHNSNLPPSTDPLAVQAANSLKRTRSLRRKTGNSVGGQAGHPGTTLLKVEHPDRVVHSPQVCKGCLASLSDSPVVKREKRQVFDLPPVKVEVIENQVETRKCVACSRKTKASFPVRVKAPVQCGEGVRARAIYLQKYQLLPFERTSQAMKDLFGCGIRASTLHNARENCSRKLIRTEARIKAALQESAVIGVDETGGELEVEATGYI